MARPSIPGEVAGRFGPGSEANRQESQFARLPIDALPGELRTLLLTAAQRSAWFDASGRGKIKQLFGWAIPNGNNGTPNLNGLFPRFSTTVAGGTGGVDTQHAHAGTFAIAAHDHTLGDGYAQLNPGYATGGKWDFVVKAGVTNWAPSGCGSVAAVASDPANTHGVQLAGSTDDAAAASVTGQSADFDNRPAFYEIVPVVRLAT